MEMTKERIDKVKDMLFNEMDSSVLRCAYSMVLTDLMDKGSILVGKYNAKDTNVSFMYGVGTVMEKIATGTGDIDLLDKFEDMFYSNLVLSGIKASER